MSKGEVKRGGANGDLKGWGEIVGIEGCSIPI
jgi:hypothetical protein